MVFILSTKQLFKSGIMFVSTLMLGGVITTSVAGVKANAAVIHEEQQVTDLSSDFKALETMDSDELAYQLSTALQAEGIDFQSIQDNHAINKRGIKGKAAKVAAKAAMAALKKMGKKAWNKAISSVPLIKGFLKKYLNYQSVMKVLQVVSGFEDNITDAMSKEFQHEGMPKWAADITARAVATILL